MIRFGGIESIGQMVEGTGSQHRHGGADGPRSARIVTTRKLTRAKGIDKPTEKVEVCRTGWVVESWMGWVEDRERGVKTPREARSKDRQRLTDLRLSLMRVVEGTSST